MLEQQLVDYIKKAKAAGQTDEQSRNLLFKNGWTEQEVNDAFAEINQPKPQLQPQIQPQQEIKSQPQGIDMLKTVEQPRVVSQAQPQIQSTVKEKPVQKSSHLILKLAVILIILVALGGIGWFTYLNNKPQNKPVVPETVNNPVTTPVTTQPENQQPPVTVSPEVQKITDNLNNISSLAKSGFNTNNDFSTLCYKGLLNGYNKEAGPKLIEYNNDIIAQGGEKPACYASTTDYCVSTKLADGSYLCAGYKLVGPGSVQCISAQTVCE